MKNGEDFSTFIWQFVNGQPIINGWELSSQVPAETELSKFPKLKNVGLNLSAHYLLRLYASNMINDHLVNCCQFK